MVETVLMRTYLMFYVTGFETDDDSSPVIFGQSRTTERQAFIRLCSVCWSWHQTLTGWTESPTSHWVRHQLKKLIEREYTHQTSARYFCTRKGPPSAANVVLVLVLVHVLFVIIRFSNP